jgi:hypothetical protein
MNTIEENLINSIKETYQYFIELKFYVNLNLNQIDKEIKESIDKLNDLWDKSNDCKTFKTFYKMEKFHKFIKYFSELEINYNDNFSQVYEIYDLKKKTMFDYIKKINNM